MKRLRLGWVYFGVVPFSPLLILENLVYSNNDSSATLGYDRVCRFLCSNPCLKLFSVLTRYLISMLLP
jgi:hypothetical protein